MCHQYNRNAFFIVEFLEKLHDFNASMRIQTSRWLICKEQFRVRHDGARNGNTLLLTAGKLADTAVRHAV